ncbi:phosphotransferase [Streptomyces sp. NPDC059378]|uniref:phosphotransferase n=1 Tax=Streptomyces sp. NPDC059378 TaxID=3346815 RepID=UPI0036C0B7B0
MTSAHFTKFYETPKQVDAAVRHHWWLTEHAHPMRLPAFVVVGHASLTYQWIEGRPVQPEDLTALATLLGHAHGCAWTSDLRAADLATPHRFQDGTAFADYLGPRQVALQRRLEQGYLPNKAALLALLALLEKTAEGPVSFYKDSNPRNFLITPSGAVVTVDTDDLTLAPMAYDLAKLIATLLLTYGPLPHDAIGTALNAYNKAAGHHDIRLGATDRSRLDEFLALHAVLTAPYIGRHGYSYGWPPTYPRLRG